jgi:plasmid stabilization system protein ParE
MPRLIWSPEALQDVHRVYRFLAEKNGNAAIRATAAIRNGVKPIGRYPEIGRPIEGMPTEFREWLIAFGDSGYAVMYRFDGKEVVLLAVRHQREAGYR